MKELLVSHTSKNLKHEILGVLPYYECNRKNVYSLTVDNAYVKLLEYQPCEKPDGGVFQGSEDSLGNDVEDVRIFHFSLESSEFPTFIAELLEKLDDEFSAYNLGGISGNSIQHVNFSAHSLQLAVEDASEDCKTGESMERARKLVKKLKTPSISQVSKKLNFTKLSIDCAIRGKFL